MANCKLQMFAQWQQQSNGNNNNSPECDRTYWVLIHESSHNFTKSPRVQSWLRVMTPYFQMWNNSSYQNPKSKIQDPISPQAQKLCILENKIKKLDKYNVKMGKMQTETRWRKIMSRKKVVYNSKLYHILIWCVQLFFARPIKSARTIT